MKSYISNETLQQLTNEELKQLQNYFIFMGKIIYVDFRLVKEFKRDIVIGDTTILSSMPNRSHYYKELPAREVRNMIFLSLI